MIKEEELKKMFKEEIRESKDVKIHYDKKRQIYTIRLPTIFAKEIKLNEEKDKFRFILVSKYSEEKEELQTKLKGEIVHG